jgi:hypothetical protein
MPGKRSIYALTLGGTVTFAAAGVLLVLARPARPSPRPLPPPVALVTDEDGPICEAPPGACEAPPPPVRAWHEGQRSAPGEREAIDQDLSPIDVDASKLVDIRDLVAGADPMSVRGGRSEDERWLVSPEIALAMGDLRDLIHERLGPDVQIWLNGAYDSSRRAHHHNSMHYTGRAVDLDLWRKGEKLDDQVGVLAALAAQVFSRQSEDGRLLHFWVQDEGNHVHASLESPSLTAVPRPVMNMSMVYGQATDSVNGPADWPSTTTK